MMSFFFFINVDENTRSIDLKKKIEEETTEVEAYCPAGHVYCPVPFWPGHISPCERRDEL